MLNQCYLCGDKKESGVELTRVPGHNDLVACPECQELNRQGLEEGNDPWGSAWEGEGKYLDFPENFP